MLDKRLKAIAALVRPNSRVADIGTDHALLPCALVQTGQCPSAIASDVRVGPAEAARRSVTAAGLSEAIDIRVGNGLETVLSDEVDDVVIAGMGGETIVSILDRAPWLKNERYRLLLQPMTRAEILRRYLFENGFGIDGETAVQDGKHWYTVLCVQYQNTPFIPTPTQCFIGKLPCDARALLDGVCVRLTKQLAAKPDDDLARCLAEIKAYQKGRWSPWEM